MAALDPVLGGEIAKTRPVIVLSVDDITSSPLDVAIVAAITTTPGEPGVRIELPQEPGQPRRISYVLPHQVRTISNQRLIRRSRSRTLTYAARSHGEWRSSPESMPSGTSSGEQTARGRPTLLALSPKIARLRANCRATWQFARLSSLLHPSQPLKPQTRL